MNKIKWGFLSTAKIGLEKVGPALKKSELGQFYAIASRSLETAKRAAEQLDIPKAYGSYQELLDDPDLQAVYIPLPNHLHMEWTKKALEADKHVLCEKPLTPNWGQTKAFVDLAAQYPKLKVMEAFMYRFHPQWNQVRSWIDQKKIGELRTIHADFFYYNTDPANIRNIRDYGGGGLLDIGCYCISVARFLFQKEPLRVCGSVEIDPQFKTDRLATGVLDFSDGTSSFTCSTQLPGDQGVLIRGTKGSIKINMPFNPAPDEEITVKLIIDGRVVDKASSTADQYTLECDHFSRSILENRPVPTSLEDALNNARVIEGIFRSSESGKWIVLSDLE